jgi:hypothetical protein
MTLVSTYLLPLPQPLSTVQLCHKYYINHVDVFIFFTVAVAPRDVNIADRQEQAEVQRHTHGRVKKLDLNIKLDSDVEEREADLDSGQD